MEYIANYHNHTKRCGHAKGEDREFIEAAIALGLKEMGFSDHSPMPVELGFNDGFRVKENEARNYFDSLKALQEEYKNDIKIRIGVEAEYYPATNDRFIDYLSQFPLEYMILGQHFILAGNDRPSSWKNRDAQALTDYFNNVYDAAATGNYLYIAHPDILNYPNNDKLYIDTVDEFLTKIKPLNIPLEINALGAFEHRDYPRKLFWERVAKHGNPVVIGVDAHWPEAYSPDYLKNAFELAESFGFDIIKSFDDSHFTGNFKKSTER